MPLSEQCRFATALSTAQSIDKAVDDAGTALFAKLGSIDLLLAFACSPQMDAHSRLPALLAERFGPRCLAGCSAGGVLADGEEIESGPGLVLVGAKLPNATAHAVHLQLPDLPDPDASPATWVERIGVDPVRTRGFVILTDPFRFDAQQLVQGLDYAYPNVPKVGGLASGGRTPDSVHLYMHRERPTGGGAVLIAFTGDIEMQPVVAQGCSGFGKTGTITECTERSLKTVDNIPAFEFLEAQAQSVSDDERSRIQRRQVLLGVAANDPFADHDTGDDDFLVRNVLGHERSTGALTIGDQLRPGRRVRFMFRDATTSAEDIRTRLGAAAGRDWHGALMFSCMGRGRGLYGEPNFDSHVFSGTIGSETALGGFFCNGEIGPVGSYNSTFVHGYTSSFALFRSPSKPA